MENIPPINPGNQNLQPPQRETPTNKWRWILKKIYFPTFTFIPSLLGRVSLLPLTQTAQTTYGVAKQIIQPTESTLDAGSDVSAAVFEIGAAISEIGGSTSDPIKYYANQTLDITGLFSGLFGILSSVKMMVEAHHAENIWFKIEGSMQFVSSIIMIAYGAMSATIAVLSLIPEVSMAISTASQVMEACSFLLFVVYALQSIKSFIYAGQCFYLHANLAYKNPGDKVAYLKQFVGDQNKGNEHYIEKLIGKELVSQLKNQTLSPENLNAQIQKIENKILWNGLFAIGSGLIQSSIAALSLYVDIHSAGLSSLVIQAFSIAIGSLFAFNTVYDISLILSGTKNERIPAFQTLAYRKGTAIATAASLVSSAILCSVANFLNLGDASIALLALGALMPIILNLANRLWAYYTPKSPQNLISSN
jgi:hypothetical protein